MSRPAAASLTGPPQCYSDDEFDRLTEFAKKISAENDPNEQNKQIPWDWIPPRPDRINDAALVELRQHIPHHSKERQRIINQFKSTMPSSKIHAIHRIQNATLYRNYERSRLELTQKGVKFTEVKDLFHGTRLAHPREIYGSDVGFDVSKCLSISKFGSPVAWFASYASYSCSRFSHQIGTNARPPFMPLTGGPIPVDRVRMSCILVAHVLAEPHEIHSYQGPQELYTIAESARALPVALIVYS